MTQFKDLELIYNEFSCLAEEINNLIDKEDYETAILKLKHKDKIIKKLLAARNTVDFTPEQRQKLNLMENKIKDNEHKILNSLKELQNEVGKELNVTKKKVKISSAYSIHAQEKQGRYIDISE
ncbi:MAG: hypothetical protein PHC64_06870 [Candidatus Gastranaerophilales bacterium]|nr:hypothetical protein [Candidatus Gastranaerophilales bacterium]